MVPVRLTPSSFDPDDVVLAVLSRPIDWRWGSLEEALAAFPGAAASYMLPLFWQMEPPVFAACRSAMMPLFATQPDNEAVAAASLRYAAVDTLVIEAGAAERLQAHFEMYKDPSPKLWFVLHDARAERWRDAPPKLSNTVWQEVHLMPGVPVLVQCVHLARAGAQRFHRAKTLSWDASGRVSSLDGIAMRDASLPFSLETAGTCPCGEETMHAHA